MRATMDSPKLKNRSIFPALLFGIWLVVAAVAGARMGKTHPVADEGPTAAAPPVARAGRSVEPQVEVLPKGVRIYAQKQPPVAWKTSPEPFGFNSSALTSGQIEQLKNAAEQLKNQDNWVVIEGHRDSSERAGLSQDRANQARDYLVGEMGIDAARIVLRNLCAQCPAPVGDSNRRIEIGVVPRESNIPPNFSLNTAAQCPAAVQPCHEMPAMLKQYEIKRKN